jgi:hypothetical protein
MFLQCVRGELGGTGIVKYATGTVCLSLWCMYIIMASLKAYGIIFVEGED